MAGRENRIRERSRILQFIGGLARLFLMTDRPRMAVSFVQTTRVYGPQAATRPTRERLN